MFKSKKKFKPYQMPPRRIKPWCEQAWIQATLLVGVVGSTLAWAAEGIGDAIDCCTLSGSDDIGSRIGEDDGFETRHRMDSDDSFTFSHDEDDLSRGLWDVTSIYYPMFHSDEHSFLESFHHD